MKFFTPELFIRLQECPAADAFSAINAAWEQAAQQYGAQVQNLLPRLSRQLRRFIQGGSMHDARVLEIGTTRRRMNVVLLKDQAPCLVSLTYYLVDAAVIDRTALPQEHQSLPPLWLYDEIDRDADMLYHPGLRVQNRASALSPQAIRQDGWKPIFLHSILLSNGWEIRLRFHHVTAVRMASLLPSSEPTCQPESSLSPGAQVEVG